MTGLPQGKTVGGAQVNVCWPNSPHVALCPCLAGVAFFIMSNRIDIIRQVCTIKEFV